MRKIVLLLAATSLFITVNSQIKDRCGSTEMIRQEMAANPAYAKKVEELLKNKGNYSRNNQKGKPDNPGKPPAPRSITIPVIVHVLYSTPEQNISDAQVQSQIDVLNEDYSATNSDYNKYDAGYSRVKGDLDIQFCLRQVIHKQSTHKSFSGNNMKFTQKGGSDAVDPMHALNIWVCDIGKKLLGFAYYPGAPLDISGVVCHTNAFGRGAQYNLFTNYDLGRTMTHEVGHSLGLAHIWGDNTCGSDEVDDTPLHNTANFGCPEQGHLSTCTGTPLEMWMNYMDYTDDRCMYFFTDGQGARASFFIDTDPQLSSIVNSACGTTRQVSNDITTITNPVNGPSRMRLENGFSLYPTITTGPLTISLNNLTGNKAEIMIYSQTGALMRKQQINLTGKTIDQIDVSRLGNGVYFLQLNNGAYKETKKFLVQH